MQPTGNSEQKTIRQVTALVEINPQSLADVEVDYYSNIVAAKSFKGWLIRLIRPIQIFFRTQFPEANAVLNDVLDRTQKLVKDVLRHRSNDHLQTMNGRSVTLRNVTGINDDFYMLLNAIAQKLQVAFEMQPKEMLNLVQVKAIANLDAALQQEMPIKQLAQVAETGTTTEDGWGVLKKWFELFRTEGRVICANSTLKAFAGSLYCQHTDYNENTYISRLVLQLLRKGYISLEQFDIHSKNNEDTWKKEIVVHNTQYELGNVVLNESLRNRHLTLFATGSKDLKSPEIHIITSRNEMRLVEWYGIHRESVSPIKTIPIVKLDELYRYVVVSSPQIFFDKMGNSSLFSKELGRVIEESVALGISCLPESSSLVLFADQIHTLVPCVGIESGFWMQDLAEWVFKAVSNSLDEYTTVVDSKCFKGHSQYRFFSEVTYNFITGKGVQNIERIASRYGFDLAQKQLEIAKFIGHLKDLRTSDFKKDSDFAKKLQAHHLIFPFCMTQVVIDAMR